MTPNVQQRTATQDRDELRLIPPLADEFDVYGGPDTVERAREWALDWHYLLADGIPKCAHGLYLMPSCPVGRCHSKFSHLDHARIWVPADPEFGRPFVLSHLYAPDIPPGARQYADAHGLDLVPGRAGIGTGWYGSGTIPVSMTIPASWPLWPIEAKAAVLLSIHPVAWPPE